MKKWITVLAALMLAVIVSVPVYAAGDVSTEGGVPEDDEDAIVVYDWETGQPSGGSGASAQIGGPAPVDIRMDMVGDIPYITRYYEMDGELGLAEVPQGFEQDGYRFTRHDLLKQEIPATVDSKEVSKTEVMPCEKEDAAMLLQVAEAEIKYDENGYTGTLKPDVDSIRFEEGDRSSYSYTLTETREYPGLPANDASYIDKTITKNGATLQLDGIEWEVTGSSPTDTGLVPTQYKGIATYTGRATGSKVSSYTGYLTYSGEVTKTTPGIATYAVVFRGEPIPIPVIEPVVEEKKPSNLWLYCLIGVLVVGVAIAIIVMKRRGVFSNLSLWEDEEDDEDEYEMVMPPYAPEPATDQPTSLFAPLPANMLTGEPDADQKKADTAANILAAIEGIDEAEPPKPRRRPGSRKDTVPLVEKLDENMEDYT